MEFGLSKCGVLIMKRGKVVESDGLCMPDGTMMLLYNEILRKVDTSILVFWKGMTLNMMR